MILRKCKKNHFYDSDKFAKCPFCAIEKSGLEEETQSFSSNSMEKTETIVKSEIYKHSDAHSDYES